MKCSVNLSIIKYAATFKKNIKCIKIKSFRVSEFKQFNFRDEVFQGVDAMGYDKPTPIQIQAIPAIMEGKDVLGCAQTGTGKTAAFLLPILNRLCDKTVDSHKIYTMIIVPTRELALQIDQQLEGFGYFMNLSFISVYGGGDSIAWDQQKTALVQGAEIVIATPGRMISHLALGYVDLSHLEHLVLDEADRMLDMGFYDDIMTIVKMLPKKRQTLLFSATMPPRMRQLAKSILHEPVQIDIMASRPADNAIQGVYMIEEDQKLGKIVELFSKDQVSGAIVFASSKIRVKEINSALKKLNLDVAAIHSDLDQKEREEVMRRFKNGKLQILVATDIISRGIDVEGLELIINYDVPHDPEDYIHRIGRTARAEKSGVALTFVSKKDSLYLKRIEKFLGNSLFKIPT
jgi:ATP-dependent RNA helicase RhlE